VANKDANVTITLKDRVSGGLKSIQGGFKSFKSHIFSLKGALAGIFAGAFAKGVVGATSQMEQWGIAFTTMLKSADKAKVLMDEMSKFSATTPFEMTEVVDAGKQLLAFGFTAEEIIPTLTTLGNISAGLSVPISRLNLVLGQVKASGRLMGQDLLQFTNAGVPIIKALSQTMGIAESQVKDFVSAGKVGYPEVLKALQHLGDGSGQFAGLMEAQSKSLGGIFSNIKDGLFRLATKIGDAMLPKLKEVSQAIARLLASDRFAKFAQQLGQGLGETIGIIFAGFQKLKGILIWLSDGGYKAVGAITAGIGLLTVAIGAFRTFLNVTFVQLTAGAVGFGTALNIAFAGLPLIIGGLTALVIGLATAFGDLFKKLEDKSVEELNKELAKTQEQMDKLEGKGKELSNGFFVTFLKKLKEGILNLANNTKSAIGGIGDSFEKISEKIKKWVDYLKSINPSKLFEDLKTKGKESLNDIGSNLKGFGSNIKKYATDKLNEASQEATNHEKALFKLGMKQQKINNLLKDRNKKPPPPKEPPPPNKDKEIQTEKELNALKKQKEKQDKDYYDNKKLAIAENLKYEADKNMAEYNAYANLLKDKNLGDEQRLDAQRKLQELGDKLAQDFIDSGKKATDANVQNDKEASDAKYNNLLKTQEGYLDAEGNYHARSLEQQKIYLETILANENLTAEQRKQTQDAIDNITLSQAKAVYDKKIQQQQDFATSMFALGEAISDAQQSSEENKQKAIGEAIKNFLIGQIDLIEKTEVAKALAQAPLSFGSTLLAIAPIIAAAEAGKAGLRSIKFHQGGVVTDQNSLPVPNGDSDERQIIVKKGERVLTEQQQRSQSGSSGGTIQVNVMLDKKVLGKAMADLNNLRGAGVL
jgi:tape measure domain-containing protein